MLTYIKEETENLHQNEQEAGVKDAKYAIPTPDEFASLWEEVYKSSMYIPTAFNGNGGFTQPTNKTEVS